MPNTPLRICAFDLETVGIIPDVGIILCAVLKEPGQDPTVLRIDECNPDWAARPQDDQRLVDQLARRLEEYDVWVVFNGACFDIRFVRGRLAHWGLTPLATRALIDPYLLARGQLRLPKHSLAALASYLGLGRKCRLNTSVWARATIHADREALDQIVEHCQNDVVLLERLLPYLKTHCPQPNDWGLS